MPQVQVSDASSTGEWYFPTVPAVQVSGASSSGEWSLPTVPPGQVIGVYLQYLQYR